jgi:hypothetical protein
MLRNFRNEDAQVYRELAVEVWGVNLNAEGAYAIAAAVVIVLVVVLSSRWWTL